MIDSRAIADLHPKVAKLCEQFIYECRKAGIDVLITSTFRDNEMQAKLYAQGRTRAGPIVTNARPGQSFHNYRLAFDFVPIKNGKAQWQSAVLFKKCRQIGEKLGLKGLSFENAHLQWTGGLTLAELQAGKRPK